MAESRSYSIFDEYLADLPEASRESLRELRSIVLGVIPGAGETFNYNIPAVQLVPGGKREEQIMMAGYARHVGLSPHPTTMAHDGLSLLTESQEQ